MKRGPHDFDIAVGQRLRAARLVKGVSQADLAAGVGLSFQQIQKYEREQNRISASMLFEMSRVIDVPMSVLLGEPLTAANDALKEMKSADAIALLQAFGRVASPRADVFWSGWWRPLRTWNAPVRIMAPFQIQRRRQSNLGKCGSLFRILAHGPAIH